MSTRATAPSSDENTLYTANVIANTSIEINGEKVDVTTITPELLSGTLQEAGDIEANVATGYHAIEFLLWGQDLNGTGPGAGERPFTDYDQANCTGGHCDRRADIWPPPAICWSPIWRKWSPTGRPMARRARR